MSHRDPQVFDAVLGISRVNGDTSTCSKCGGSIPEEHVPLIIWDHTGHLMWVFCDGCDAKIFKVFPLVTA